MALAQCSVLTASVWPFDRDEPAKARATHLQPNTAAYSEGEVRSVGLDTVPYLASLTEGNHVRTQPYFTTPLQSKVVLSVLKTLSLFRLFWYVNNNNNNNNNNNKKRRK